MLTVKEALSELSQGKTLISGEYRLSVVNQELVIWDSTKKTKRGKFYSPHSNLSGWEKAEFVELPR